MLTATTRDDSLSVPASRSDTQRPGFFSHLIASYQQARLRAAERDVARFIDMKGGRMTDSLEREIERNFA